MKNSDGCQPDTWFIRNRMTLLTLAVVIAYAVFIQWFWGWPSILAQWAEMGICPSSSRWPC